MTKDTSFQNIKSQWQSHTLQLFRQLQMSVCAGVNLKYGPLVAGAHRLAY